jgi:predicted ester cyclase
MIEIEAGEVRIAEMNKAAVLSMLAAAEREGLTAQADFFAERVTNHGVPGTRADVRAVLQDISTTFPDAGFELLDVVAAGEWVVVRCFLSGTHLGVGRHPFVHEGLLAGVAPTGKRVRVQHIHMFRLSGGLVVEHWGCRDDVGMMRQLGLPLDIARSQVAVKPSRESE